MKRSLSGESVHVSSLCTIKWGSPMVAQQGLVMRRIGMWQPEHLPRIYHVGETWYAMQTIHQSLGPPAYRKWDWRKAAVAMSHYWFMPEDWFYRAAPMFKSHLLLEYIEEQGWSRDIELPRLAELQKLYENEEPRLTHGDLTHENTVIERTMVYKFIDWQAQRHPYIAPHSDVDYGKIMQSLIGWGKDSHCSRTEETARDIREIIASCPMAPFWCAVHFMRIKVRAKEAWQKEVCDENIDYCSWLMEMAI
jgi:hypothetical protein